MVTNVYCHKCGSQLKDGALFCSNCGAAVGEDTQTHIHENLSTNGEVIRVSSSTVEPKKKHSITKYILIALAVIVCAWLFGFIQFGPDDEDNYKQGVVCYEMGDYEKASRYFNKIDGDFKSKDLYIILCQGHVNEYLLDEQIKTLKKNLEFEDTKSLLLSNTEIAFNFLKGYWTSEDGLRYFEFYEQGDYSWIQYNLPFDDHGDGDFYIIDGMIGVESEKSEDSDDSIDAEKNDMFRVTILGADKIAIVALKDESRYVMTRDT